MSRHAVDCSPSMGHDVYRVQEIKVRSSAVLIVSETSPCPTTGAHLDSLNPVNVMSPRRGAIDSMSGHTSSIHLTTLAACAMAFT